MIHFSSFWSNIFQITKNDDHRHFQKIFVTSHNKQIFRDLQHDTRIESCRIVCRIDEKYDLSYSIGRMANSSFDTKR